MLTKKQIEELLATVDEVFTAFESQKDEPTECDGTCKGNDAEDVSDECYTTPIDDCITTFINKCTAEGKVPTLEEAQSICILDYINSKYN